MTYAKYGLTFNQFQKENMQRCRQRFSHDWSESDWITAIVGELGEAANIVKKRKRKKFDTDEM